MTDKKNFVVGVLGVATYATINFFEQWAKVFPAEKEWDRPRIIIDNNCTLPSRVRALLYNENVDLLVEGMTASIEMLIQAGVSRILIACNTAHVFLPAIYEKCPQVREFVFDIADSCVERLKRRGVKKTFLLASEGTILAGLYQKKFADAGIDCGAPPTEEFFMVRNFIEAVKHDDFSPEVKAQFVDFSRRASASGRSIILGCTELPVMRDKCADEVADVNFFDPMMIALEDLKAEFDTLPN